MSSLLYIVYMVSVVRTAIAYCVAFFLMIRRPPIATRTDTLFPYTRSSDLSSPDPTRGEVVKAFVVLSSGWEPSQDLVKALQEQVKKTTAPYKYPRRIEFVADLPKTASGKIRRTELRDHEWPRLHRPGREAVNRPTGRATCRDSRGKEV